MHWGRYKGKPITAIPSGYLRWLTREAKSREVSGDINIQRSNIFLQAEEGDEIEWQILHLGSVAGSGTVFAGPGGTVYLEVHLLRSRWAL